MTEEITEIKVKHLLDHWIEHNEIHSKSFRDWAKKLKAANFGDVSECILLAADKIDGSSVYLEKAKERI